MKNLRDWAKPSIIALAGCAIAASLVILPSRSESAHWGAGGGEWVRTQAARNYDAVCQNPNQGDEWCREWCELNQNTQVLEPTGQFCCVGPDGVCNAADIFF